MVDYLHCFHLGYGIDLAASTVVLLAQDGFYGGHRAFDVALAAGYAEFMKWCHENGRQTNIREFSKLKFDMESNLGCFLAIDRNCSRNTAFPTSLGGKAFDTAVVLSWLDEFMANIGGQVAGSTMKHFIPCPRSLRLLSWPNTPCTAPTSSFEFCVPMESGWKGIQSLLPCSVAWI